MPSCSWCGSTADTVRMVDGRRMDFCTPCAKERIDKPPPRDTKKGRTDGSRWRRKSIEVITRVINENRDAPYADVKRKIRNAYPFGERAYWPYRCWLEEVNRLWPKPEEKS